MLLLNAGLILLVAGLSLTLFAAARLARPRHAGHADAYRIDPGPQLAGHLLVDLMLCTVNERGRRRVSHVTLHSIHGPSPASPRFLVGFSHLHQCRCVIDAEEIVALKNLDTGEVYADMHHALRDLIEHAGRHAPPVIATRRNLSLVSREDAHPVPDGAPLAGR